MGRSISKVFDRLLGKKEMKILILGLDCAGKTTILYKLKLGKIVETTPTIGFNVEMVEWKNIKFTVWDACSQERARRLWKHYAENTHGLIFVVDSSDKERIEEAKSEFQKMLDNDELRDAALLIFANKLDRKVMSVAEIAEKLELTKLKDRSWNIQGCSAVTAEGLYEGLDWLSTTLSQKK